MVSEKNYAEAFFTVFHRKLKNFGRKKGLCVLRKKGSLISRKKGLFTPENRLLCFSQRKKSYAL